MPYGVRRGFKSPGEFGLMDMLSLGSAGAAGIVAALVTDYQQSAEGAALYTLNRWAVSLGSLVGFPEIPLFTVIIAIIALGAGSIFYFQPITRQGAFAQGFGLLAVIMTAIPDDFASGIENIVSDPNFQGIFSAPATLEPSNINFEGQGLLDQHSGQSARVINASLLHNAPSANIDASKSEPTQINVALDDRKGAQYVVRLYVTFEGGFSGDINSLIRRGHLRGKLHNEDTGESYNLFRNAGGVIRHSSDVITIDAGIPARSQKAKLWVRIECTDHKIEVQSAEAILGEQLVWKMTVKKSNVPMFWQRLNRVYWF